MSKRWTLKDDQFLVAYADIGLDFIASHDLGFHGKNAGTNRMKKLKEFGLLEKIVVAQKAAEIVGLHWNLAFGPVEAMDIAFCELTEMGELAATHPQAPAETAS
jgi:hypothetical protein